MLLSRSSWQCTSSEAGPGGTAQSSGGVTRKPTAVGTGRVRADTGAPEGSRAARTAVSYRASRPAPSGGGDGAGASGAGGGAADRTIAWSGVTVMRSRR
ncbi:hypothetical protein [Streptomyces canus]|uniref:hypothetical protein n=1 Tax=Streptomyces canus TaxID=58343 RepID=UPI0003805CEE|nr:hypothetical protein [Streptomyces canus]